MPRRYEENNDVSPEQQREHKKQRERKSSITSPSSNRKKHSHHRSESNKHLIDDPHPSASHVKEEPKSDDESNHRHPRLHESDTSGDRHKQHRHGRDRDSDHQHSGSSESKRSRNSDASFDRSSTSIKNEEVHVKREPHKSKWERNDSAQQPYNRSASKSHPSAAIKPEPEEAQTEAEKEKPNFGLSGKLTEETNTFRGVVIKYSEPQEARKPKKRWRFYPFKGDESLPVLHISRQSAYLLGRDRKIADMPVDHPSCSKQHAVLQYRMVDYDRPDGTRGRQVRPYIIDLESANGTYVNNKRIDAKRYVELRERDVLKFGFSSREYVLLHDKSSTEATGENSGDSEGLE